MRTRKGQPRRRSQPTWPSGADSFACLAESTAAVAASSVASVIRRAKPSADCLSASPRRSTSRRSHSSTSPTLRGSAQSPRAWEVRTASSPPLSLAQASISSIDRNAMKSSRPEKPAAMKGCGRCPSAAASRASRSDDSTKGGQRPGPIIMSRGAAPRPAAQPHNPAGRPAPGCIDAHRLGVLAPHLGLGVGYAGGGPTDRPANAPAPLLNGPHAVILARGSAAGSSAPHQKRSRQSPNTSGGGARRPQSKRRGTARPPSLGCRRLPRDRATQPKRAFTPLANGPASSCR